MELALGFKPHSGWAIAVIAGGSATAPLVLARQRVTLCPEALPRQTYHAAHGLQRAKAARLVDEVEAAVEATTTGALAALLDDASAYGEVVAVGIVGTPRDHPTLDSALATHAMLHSAEGELYRGALAAAATAEGLPVVPAPPKRTVEEVAIVLGQRGPLLAQHLTALRAVLGAPWQADHKDATAAALLALHLVR